MSLYQDRLHKERLWQHQQWLQRSLTQACREVPRQQWGVVQRRRRRGNDRGRGVCSAGAPFVSSCAKATLPASLGAGSLSPCSREPAA